MLDEDGIVRALPLLAEFDGSLYESLAVAVLRRHLDAGSLQLRDDALVLEGWATYGNLVELGKRRKQTPLFRYLRETKDSDLVVVFGENAAAVLGLLFALIAVFIWWYWPDGK